MPFVLMFIAVVVMSFDDQLFLQCIGKPLAAHGRYAAWERIIVAILCSPYYLRDFLDHWLNIAVFFVSAGFAIQQTFWIRRHDAYWDGVREKEKAKRAAKSDEKTAD